MPSTALAVPRPPVPERCPGFLTHLVLRCGQGDEAALGDLFDLTYFLIADVVSPGGLTSAVSDQEVVDAFWRIWHHAPAYVPSQSGVLAWVLDRARDRPPSPPGRVARKPSIAR
jgi:hypothetical protein